MTRQGLADAARSAARKLRTKRVGLAFLVVAIIATAGLWRIETQQGTLTRQQKQIGTLAHVNARLLRGLKHQQIVLARQTEARRKERSAQIKAIDKAIREGCEGQHALATAVVAILQRSMAEVTVPKEEAQIKGLLGGKPLSASQHRAIIDAVKKAREQGREEIALAQAGATCPTPPKTPPKTTAKTTEHTAEG